jgi:hypothetical protein
VSQDSIVDLDFDPLLDLDEDYLLERESRLSTSILWRLQRRYFEDTPESFSSGSVPTFATTNAFIAEAYARLIHAFAADCAAPVTVLELGAGHGRFGFLCLTLLLERLRQLGPVPPIRYVLSDFTRHSLDAWLVHPRLAGLLADGVLDIACFDAEQDDGLTLARSGERIDPSRPCGPLVVIANYVFDGLIQDAFQIRDGVLKEGRITLVADEPWPDAGQPGLLDTLTALFTYVPLPVGPFYADPMLDDVLEFYRCNLRDSAFGFPVGAIRCLRNLRSLSTGPLLVLSSDKAHNHIEQLQGQSAPMVATHGSVSMMTNHDALARYVTGQGGEVLLTSTRTEELSTAALVLGGAAGERLRGTFLDGIERFSPGDFLDLTRFAVPGSLAGCLKVLRLACWDPVWLEELCPILAIGLSRVTPAQRAELLEGLDRAEALRFAIDGEEDGEEDGGDDALTMLRAALLATSPRTAPPLSA